MKYYDLQIEQLISNKKFNLLEKSLENVPQQPKINYDDLTELANQIVPLRAKQLIEQLQQTLQSSPIVDWSKIITDSRLNENASTALDAGEVQVIVNEITC